jgi:nucleoid-associated protein YgaU
MSISANSRYANSLVVAVNDDGADVSVITPSPSVAYSFTYISYMLTQYDRLDNLAQTYYGDPTQWWRIAQANPDVAMDWTSVTPGTVIRIPTS